MTEFVDETQLNARGGDGGAGAVAFRREAHVSKGGPDGGDGAPGGDLILRAETGIASLGAFSDHPHRRAVSGGHGSGSRRHGARGSDVVVPVPVGTVVKSPQGEVVADLSHPGARFLAARGGRGGRGNASFLSNARRAPSFAEQGEYGEERWLRLELKLLADVALVGFPNAGKSTLISVVSAARPKVAAYPFTTLVPHLGVVRHREEEFVVADVPGLIEGAAEGRGLGHQFLRHVERARVLVLLLDLASVDGRSPEDQERVLLAELGRYRPELLERPRVVVGTKADVAQPELSGGFAGLRISAVTRDGLDQLLDRLVTEVRWVREEPPPEDSAIILRPMPEGVSVSR
ncbi:MAG: GTPase ObgE, partial [Acidimicrobiia bacterium]